MKRYNHLYSLAFSVVSNEKDGADVTPDMLRAALSERIRKLDADPNSAACEWFEACNNESDTYEVEEFAEFVLDAASHPLQDEAHDK